MNECPEMRALGMECELRGESVSWGSSLVVCSWVSVSESK